jgi:hypothetical protein
MKTPHGVFCDVCSVPRSEAGQWRMLLISEFRDIRVLGVFDWDDKMADTANARHACSNGCTHTLVDRYLSTRSFDKPVFKAAAAVAEPGGAA